MAQKYFKNFPLVQYGDHSVRNIILKAKLARDLLDKFDNFYPYTIQEGQRITDVAYDYYGAIDYVWLIMAANEMVDPYYDWPLNDDIFNTVIEKKYGSVANAMNIANAQYYRKPNMSYWMTKTTYENSAAAEREGWQAVDNYTYEMIKNEDKRKIRLLDRSIALDVSLEIEKTFKKAGK